MKKVSQCKGCRRPIIFVRKAENTQKWAVLDAAPVRPALVRDYHQVRIIDGPAYTVQHMREHLDMRFSFETDRGPIEDFPHHTVHDCPARKERT